jgi:putative DNA primase/helicase
MVRRRTQPPTTDELLNEAEKSPVQPHVVQDDEHAPAVRVADLGEAEVSILFAEEIKGRYCWTAGLGWLKWDGRRWARTPDADVTDRAKEWILSRYKDACERGEDFQDIKFWQSYRSAHRIKSVVVLAKGPRLADAADFDHQPDLLNVRNGVIDLATGELLPHDPSLLMMKLAPVDYQPGAGHADWTAALEALPASVRDWYQVRLGQAVTGHMSPDDIMLVQQGAGANGKTTLMAGAQAALGDYYHAVPHRALLGAVSAHSTELADFNGVRLAVLEELPEEHKVSVTRLKMLVGTMQVNARHVFKDSVTFDASHALVVNTNYRPSVNETDNGTWRRLALVRFPYRYLKPGCEPQNELERRGDPDLRHRLRDGRQGQHEAVLAWLVAGAVRWYQANRVMPPLPGRVEADTLAWRAETDLVLAYWDDRLVAAAARHIASSDLFADFNDWLQHRGHHEWSDKLIAARFEGHDNTLSNHVEKLRVRSQAGVSRPEWEAGDLGGRYIAWAGSVSGIRPTMTKSLYELGKQPSGQDGQGGFDLY